MKCDFCNRNVPTKCVNVFSAVKCQKKRADENRFKLEQLEETALAFYEQVGEMTQPVEGGTQEEWTKFSEVKFELEDLLGVDADANKEAA